MEGVMFGYAEDFAGFDILLEEIDARAFVPMEAVDDDTIVSRLSGDTLRRYASALSGLTPETLAKSVVAVVPVATNWDDSIVKTMQPILLSYIVLPSKRLNHWTSCVFNFAV